MLSIMFGLQSELWGLYQIKKKNQISLWGISTWKMNSLNYVDYFTLPRQLVYKQPYFCTSCLKGRNFPMICNLSPSLLVFYDCYKKWPQTWWLQIPEIHSLLSSSYFQWLQAFFSSRLHHIPFSLSVCLALKRTHMVMVRAYSGNPR